MSEKCKTKGCGRYVYTEAIGYCPECLREARSVEVEKPKDVSKTPSKLDHVSTIIVADETPNPKIKYNPPPKLTGGKIEGMRYPRGVCQKCGDSLAKGSNSYCRKHERERLKKWRLNRDPSVS